MREGSAGSFSSESGEPEERPGRSHAQHAAGMRAQRYAVRACETHSYRRERSGLPAVLRSVSRAARAVSAIQDECVNPETWSLPPGVQTVFAVMAA